MSTFPIYTMSWKDRVESLDLFKSLILPNSLYKETIVTKVPNGYVMTSHSGHQIFIKENTKEIIWKLKTYIM